MVIAKIHQNSSARATLKYVLSKSGASVIGGNAADWVDRDPLTQAQLATHIDTATGQIQQAIHLKSLTRPLYHISLSLPPQEALNDEQLCAFAEQYLAGLILSAEPPDLLKQLSEPEFQAAIERFRDEELYKYCYTLVRHTDQPHPHVHVVIAKTNLETEKAIPTSHDRYRSQIVLRYLERQHGLAVQPHSWVVGRKAESTQQAQAEIKTGQPSVHKQLQTILDQAATKSQTVPEFIAQVQAAGVEVRVPFTRTGKCKGISYGLHGVALAGHALGTRYSFKDSEPGLVKHLGLRYEPERDRPLIQALCERLPATPKIAQSEAPLAVDQRLAVAQQQHQAWVLQVAAATEMEEEEGPSLVDTFDPLPDQINSSPINTLELPAITSFASPQPGQSDLEPEPLPVVTDTPQPPTPQPIEAGLAAAATDVIEPVVPSQPKPTALPPPGSISTAPAVPITDSTQPEAARPTPAVTASEQRVESSPRPTASAPTAMPIPVAQAEPLPAATADLELPKLEPHRAAAQRQAWCTGIARIAHLGIQVAGRSHPESGNRVAQTLLDDEHIYQFELRPSDQTLIVSATDGRGILLAQRGAEIALSRTVTEADWDCFRRQEAHFLQLQALEAQRQRESWGRDMAAVAQLALALVGKPVVEGPRYRITKDGQTLTLAATDGRGVLLRLRGDQIQVSEHLTRADSDHFQGQRAALQAERRRQELADQSQQGKRQGGLGGIGG